MLISFVFRHPKAKVACPMKPRQPAPTRPPSRHARIVLFALILAPFLTGPFVHAQGCLYTDIGRIEAEDACAFQGTADSNHAGFSGTGFVNVENAVGSWIEWNLDLPPGPYYAHFRHANGTATDRDATLSLNGSALATALSFPPTGDWPNWALTTTVAFTPTPGTTNTLRLAANTAEGLANIDYLEIQITAQIVYTLKVNNGTGGGPYTVNSVVPISADPPTTGMRFLAWTGDIAGLQNADAADTNMTMVAVTGDATVTATHGPLPSGTYAERMAESIMIRSPNRFGNGGWEYQVGTVLRGFEELWHATANQDYYNYVKATIDRNVDESGQIADYNASILSVDEIKEIDLCLFLYRQTGDERYRLASDLVRLQYDNQPRCNAGGFWHKQIYPNQMWLDGLYMAQPFYCEYSEMFNQPEKFDDVALQFTEMYNHGVESVSGLIYHGWDESMNASWADPVTGQSPVFWSRSLGWYVMALVDVLDHFPTDHPERDELIQILQKTSAALAAVRDTDDGVWWQVPDHPGEGNNYKEASGGLMFTYAFSKGARLGYLDPSYRTIAVDAFQDHVAEFIVENTDGTLDLTDTCVGTGVGPSLAFYYGRPRATNDTKGIGPFMMAGTEVEHRQMEPLYTLTVSGGLGGGIYQQGRNVRITAGAAPEGEMFRYWTGDIQTLTDPTTSTTALVMPAGDLTLQAVFARNAVPAASWTAYEEQ
jgi:unsaturated rhamnogalacturonyl hydrolase